MTTKQNTIEQAAAARARLREASASFTVSMAKFLAAYEASVKRSAIVDALALFPPPRSRTDLPQKAKEGA